MHLISSYIQTATRLTTLTRRRIRSCVYALLMAWSVGMPISPGPVQAQQTIPQQTIPLQAIPLQAIPLQTERISPLFQPGRLLLGVEPDMTPEALSAALSAHGATIHRFYPAFNLADVTLAAAQIGAAADQTATAQAMTATLAAQTTLSALPGVRYVDLDYRVQAAQEVAPAPTDLAGTSDPLIGQQWALAKIRAQDSWNISRGSSKFTIAVIDSGYDRDHPDLPRDRLWVHEAELNGLAGIDDDGNGYIDDLHGWDWVGITNNPGDKNSPPDWDNDPDDLNGHGTHVFGIIAAGVDNGIGVAGAVPEIRIAPLRVLDAYGSGSVSDVVAALDYARLMGFRVVNMSLTVGQDILSLQSAVVATSAAGAVLVAAAGNTLNRGGSVLWPAAYPQVVAVAATDSQDRRASFSHFGPEIDLAAPGDEVLSTYLVEQNDGYQTVSGTSMAAPYVAAALALVWNLRPDLTPEQAIDLLKSTAVDVNQATLPGPDNDIGWGRIDLAAAVSKASEDLVLVDTSPIDHVVLPEMPLTLPIAVQAPDADETPVSGAVIRYRLYDDQGDSIGSEKQVVTGIAGIGNIEFDAPSEEGTYSLHTQVGLATLDVPITVFATNVTVTVTLSRTASQVGGEPVDFRVEVYNDAGDLEPGRLPLRLETTLGSFDPSGSEQNQLRIVSGGVYLGRLYPGTEAGVATLTTRVGTASDAAALTIVPGPAARVLGPADGIPVVATAAHTLTLTFVIQDAFGNSVVDGTRIEFESSDGLLEPTEAETADGRVHTDFTPHPSTHRPAQVRVTVPGTSVDVTLDVPVNRSYFIPLVLVP